MSKRKLYIRDLACQGDTPLNPPIPSERRPYIEGLACQGDTPLEPPGPE